MVIYTQAIKHSPSLYPLHVLLLDCPLFNGAQGISENLVRNDGRSRIAIIVNKLRQHAMICCCQGLIIIPPSNSRAPSIPGCGRMCWARNGCWIVFCSHMSWISRRFRMLTPEQKCGCCSAIHLKPAPPRHCSEYRRLPSIPGGGLMCRALNDCWNVFCLHPLWILRRFFGYDAPAEW